MQWFSRQRARDWLAMCTKGGGEETFSIAKSFLFAALLQIHLQKCSLTAKDSVFCGKHPKAQPLETAIF
ncbi:MAG: hypothetical protein RR315_07910 [Oscillospiraceae bacterium]